MEIWKKKKEYLNEAWYQKVKRKITGLSLIILIVSVLIGGYLIATGIMKTNASKKDAAQRLNEIAIEKEALNKQYDAKRQECDSLNMRDSDWYAKVNQCHREASAIQSQISDLNHTSYYGEVGKNIFLTIVGGIVIFVGVAIALRVYVIAKAREISAFTIQQTMPIAQEGIEKMTPTVGNAAGTIANDIVKGVKEGLKNEEK